MKAFLVTLALLFTLPSHGASPRPQDKAAPKKDKADSAAAKTEDFIRIRKDGRKLVAMETNVVTYECSKHYPDATVDLIGAVHLADPEYYKELNKLFETYDVLLYEAVKPEDAEVGQGRPVDGNAEGLSGDTMVGLSVISTLQVGMKDMLGLEFQLEGIDYTKDNFVHADMTTVEFQASMERRGESFAGMLLREMGKSLGAGQGRNPVAQQLDLMLSLLTNDRDVRLRRIMAQELVTIGAGDVFSGEDGGSTIITERNKKALRVLRKQLKSGHKRVGIFYGAGHMADMEKRLLDEFHFRRGPVKWLRAWNLSTEKRPAETPPQG